MVKQAKKEAETIIKNSKTSKKEYIHAVGRRREAVARVRLYTDIKGEIMYGEHVVKKGALFVNRKPIGEYFSGEVAKVLYTEPFRITNTEGKFSATVHVVGGGKNGQLGAVVLGLTRAIAAFDKTFRTPLKKKGLLRRDARVRERRKVGTGGKARRKKQSPKR